MAYPQGSKVVIGNETILDLTSDTVTAASMLSGVTAHDKTGARIEGTIAHKSDRDITINFNDGYIEIPAGVYSNTITVITPDVLYAQPVGGSSLPLYTQNGIMLTR